MQCTVGIFLVLCLAGFCAGASVESQLSFDAKGAKSRPVSKVVTLLKDMMKQLEKEMEEDEAIYDALACWCTTNDKEKTKAIADAEAKIKDLTNTIEELTATSNRLNAEIENLKEEIAKLQEALAQAKAMREKELAEFNENEKDMLEAIAALKAAIEVLAKHHTSLIQMSDSRVSGVAATLQDQLKRHSDLLEGVLSHKQRRIVASFIQQPLTKSYNPQSGQIFGILQQMKETFETNLAEMQKEEQAAQKAYEELKAAKEAEIAAAEDSIEKKTIELADTDEKLAMAKQDLEDTTATLSADQKYLVALKEKCSLTDKEWEERQKTRQLEMEAVSKAIAILSTDDAMDTFSSTFSFAQTRAGVSHKSLRSEASKLLQAAASKWQNPRLSALAMHVRLDAFTKVKKAIDDMIAELMKQQEDEAKHKDFCADEFNTNQLDTEKRTREKADLEAKIEDLDLLIKKLTEEIAALKAAVADMQTQLKYASEDREKENKEFQLTVADQRATQKLLQAALEVLKGFYDKKAVALAQRQEPAGPPPPPGFEAYEKNKASGGVMGEIEQIITEAKAMEAEAIADEEAAAKAYFDFVMETNASIEAAVKDIINKTEEKAQAEAEKAVAEEELEATEKELETLEEYNQELHKSCDYVLKNFEIRQTARMEEIEALKQAKAILSGAKFSAFLQSGP